MRNAHKHFKNLSDEDLLAVSIERFKPLKITLDKIEFHQKEIAKLRKEERHQRALFMSAAHWITSRKMRNEWTLK